MKTETTRTIYRKDYRPPVFEVDAVEMGFDLDPSATTVATRLHLVRSIPGPLTLDGEALELLFISVDGRRLAAGQYALMEAGEKQTLTIAQLPDSCTLDIAVRLAPGTNSSLMGLYISHGNFFTQCEAEGFRKITFFPDRPDVMARFTVMLRADKQRYPVLLSNGNLIDSGTLPDAANPFLDLEFKTVRYELEIELGGSDRYRYAEDTQLLLKGRSEVFHHRDSNTLKRIR